MAGGEDGGKRGRSPSVADGGRVSSGCAAAGRVPQGLQIVTRMGFVRFAKIKDRARMSDGSTAEL